MTDLSQFSEKELRLFNKLLEIRETRIHFAKKCHRSTKGERLDFEKFAHMKELYETVSVRIVNMGGAQVGKTDWLICDTLATCYNGLNVFFVLPKHEMRETYVQEKFLRPLDISEEYQAILKNSSFQRLAQTQFGRGVVKFVGGNSSSDFVSFSSDMYVIEETDKCDSLENLELGFSRSDQSPYKLERFQSNPTTKSGFIYKKYMESDQRQWMCPCDKCHELSPLDFFESVIQVVEDKEGNVIDYLLRDDSWKRGCGRDVRIICPKCGSGTLDRLSKDCLWLPSAESEKLIAGYHMPSLISPQVGVHELWQQWRDAIDDPTKMTRFYSMRLALPFAASGNKISDALLENCSDKDYSLELHPGFACIKGNKHPGPCSMGIDTSPSHLDIRISAYDKGKRRMVYVAKLDPKQSYMLYDLVAQYNVKVAVMDIGPEKLLAEEFRDTAKCEVWLCKYLGAGQDRFKSLNEKEMILSIDRTECLDRGYSQLKTGKNILPKNYEHLLNGAYCQEMCDLVREIEEDKKTGNVKYVWSGSGRDHHRHCDGYDLQAFEMMSEDVLISSENCYVG